MRRKAQKDYSRRADDESPLPSGQGRRTRRTGRISRLGRRLARKRCPCETASSARRSGNRRNACVSFGAEGPQERVLSRCRRGAGRSTPYRTAVESVEIAVLTLRPIQLWTDQRRRTTLSTRVEDRAGGDPPRKVRLAPHRQGGLLHCPNHPLARE